MKSIAIMKYSVKNNKNYTQDGCGGGLAYGGALSHYQVNQLQFWQQSWAILLRTSGAEMASLGEGKFFPWGGAIAPPPRYIVKKGTAHRPPDESLTLPTSDDTRLITESYTWT
jgi:hypothetical protein